jgi:hypothetical protein
MRERETSGTPRSNSTTSTATSAASGGPSLGSVALPTTRAVPPRQYSLHFLVALIKQSDQPHPSQRNG